MADQDRGWRRLQRQRFDSKNFSKRMKKAEGATTRHAHRFIVKRLDNVRNVQRHIVGWLVLVGILIAAAGLQLVWFQQSYQTVAADSGGTYADATLGPVDTLNPLYASTDAEASSARLLFSSLYTYDTTGHLHGDLATRMDVDKTGKVYTVALNPNARWHDGARLTARDVVFTLNLIKNPEARTRSPSPTAWQDVEISAKDDDTVEFKLPAVYAAFPYALTFSILPEHSLASVAPGAIRENSFSRTPIGSGPFKFKSIQNADKSGDQKVIEMTANEQYYGGSPKLGRFELHSYLTSDDILKALKVGEVNAAEITPSTADQVDHESYNLITQPINSGVYALFNVKKPQLKDPQVRRALQLATDTEALRKSIGVSVPALDLPFVNGQLGGKDIPHAPRPDAKKAAQILDKAGWKLVDGVRQKKKVKLALTITTTKNDQYEKALTTLADQWRELGVSVTTNVIDRSNPAVNFVQNTLQPRNYDVLLYELSIGADPDVYAYWHSSQIGMGGYNFSNYVDQSSDTALASARSRLEPELREAKYKAFARQWLSDVPAIGLYQSVTTYAVNKHASSVDTSMRIVSATDRYSNVLDWSVRQKSVYKTP